MPRQIRSLLAALGAPCLLVSSPAFAQDLVGRSSSQALAGGVVEVEISPRVARFGGWFLVTVTNNSSEPIGFPSTCVISGVYSNSACSGSSVSQGLLCATQVTTVLPGEEMLDAWFQTDHFGEQVPSGDYWFHILYGSSGGSVELCEAVTILPAARVPALPFWGLAGMTVLLGLAGAAMLRRHQAAS